MYMPFSDGEYPYGNLLISVVILPHQALLGEGFSANFTDGIIPAL